LAKARADKRWCSVGRSGSSARSAAHDAKPGGLTAGRASQIDPFRTFAQRIKSGYFCNVEYGLIAAKTRKKRIDPAALFNFCFNRPEEIGSRKGSFQWRSLREDSMKRLALFPIVLALGAIVLAPCAGAQAQDSRQEGPTEIDKCQAINQPGSYRLVKNLSAPSGGSCLLLTTGRITIDLAGFSITGTSSQSTNNGGIIAAPPGGPGVAVRNGTISGFNLAVQLLGGSIVEGLRILCGPASTGISAQGIVRDNTVSECQPGITADQGSTVTGNTVIGGITGDGIVVNQGSTVIGNSVTNNSVGIDANCPSNLTNNTVLNNPGGNIVLNGTGCNNTNNVAP
jgi:hypothetical protein